MYIAHETNLNKKFAIHDEARAKEYAENAKADQTATLVIYEVVEMQNGKLRLEKRKAEDFA
jgi:hypothetical protein